MIVKLALRNSLRNRRRSALTAAAICLSFSLLIVFTGMGDGAHETMAEMGIGMGLGDVVVQARGYQDDPSLDHLFVDDPSLRRRILRLPGVEHVAPRLRSDALLTAGATSVGIQVSGVDPSIEGLVSKIDTPASMVAGKALLPPKEPAARGEPPPVVIGQELAQTLALRPGDRVTLTLRPAGGGDARSGAFRVQGIFRTGVHEVDAFWAEIPLEEAQALAAAPHRLSMLAVLLKHVGDTPATTVTLRELLASRPLEVLPWMEAAPELYAVIAVDEGGMYMMMAILFIVVAAGVLNALLMSVVERTREFGILLAVGASPGRVVAVVLCEALLLGVASVAIGLMLGLAVNHHFETAGFDIQGAMGSDFQTSGILLPTHLYSKLAASKVFYSSLVIVALVILGAIYPAVRAAKLAPVEAISHE